MTNVIKHDFSSKPKKPDDTLEDVLRKALLRDFADKGLTNIATTSATEQIVQMTIESLRKIRGPSSFTVKTSVDIPTDVTLQEAVESAVNQTRMQMKQQFEEWANKVFAAVDGEILGNVAGACAAVVNALMFPENYS
jgi:hypothetical protein